MSKGLLKLPFLSLLVAAFAVGGCERVELPGEPSVPAFSARGVSPVHKVPGKHHASGSASVAALIDANGGSLELAGHRLIVPAGAISRPTRFSLTLVANGFIEVDLRAAQSSAGGSEVDVGKRGFSTPVVLQLSYAQAERVVDPTAAVIAWIRPDGMLQPLPSTSDAQAQTVTATLDHFSSYSLATP